MIKSSNLPVQSRRWLPHPPFSGPGQHTILLVEDTPLLALSVVRMLETSGMQVIGPVASRVDALELIRRTRFCGAILDWNLTDGTSGPLADQLQKRAIPFVFFSSAPQVVKQAWPERPIVEKCRLDDLRRAVHDVALRGCTCRLRVGGRPSTKVASA